MFIANARMGSIQSRGPAQSGPPPPGREKERAGLLLVHRLSSSAPGGGSRGSPGWPAMTPSLPIVSESRRTVGAAGRRAPDRAMTEGAAQARGGEEAMSSPNLVVVACRAWRHP
jgi:hypothetical protein